jgi:hypothetical protein
MPGVTITGLDVRFNNLTGTDIYSKGAVELTNFDARDIAGGDAVVKNLTIKVVTVSSPEAISNGLIGAG